MKTLAHRVVLAWGWRRAAIAFVAGAIGALAMPPFGFFPALILALVPAVWLVDGLGSRRDVRTIAAAAGIGWLWGFGYLLAGLWWLGAAFLVEAERFAWAMPLGVIALPAALALFYAAGFALARALWSPGAARVLALATGLAAAEWLRGHLFTGFPWNALGMAFGQSLPLMQAASLVGLYGLGLLAAAIAAAPATLATGRTPTARLAPTFVATLAFGGLLAFGVARLPAAPMPEVAGVALRIVQPNLPQDVKIDPARREEIMRTYLGLSDRTTSPERASVADVTHVIWPESAFPFLLHRDARALAQIAGLLPAGTTLVTGAARVDEGWLPGEEPVFYNSIQVVADDGTILDTYDKVHLVPFGEYLPEMFAAILDGVGLRAFVAVPGGFAAGTERRTLAVPGLPLIAPGICYEAVFPGAVTPRGERPGALLNVTNDAWFGDTPGPRQHYAQARLRAVEEGLPLVRAANTGISAMVDPYGRETGRLPLGTAGLIDAGLPQALRPTLYARFGDGVFAIMLLTCCVSALMPGLRGSRSGVG
ncbi:apolipoprotein N-acyltransferase [Salinarimonas ramus]|uniref:Apolipoprotein N-acyltransferase n=1 Tax=Salinarimonas ramus TaxID=690164 RepID=A0A917Q8F4_9HYPH|nr:apolipoprotein N-acyltransferase [Salinarimonas ramus]GGK34254.1 apolipoprotein N-acyltransferase [Salinarimonas ramus]